MFNACGTTKKVSKTGVAPEGITYKTIENYKNFASIQLPIEGKGFKDKANDG